MTLLSSLKMRLVKICIFRRRLGLDATNVRPLQWVPTSATMPSTAKLTASYLISSGHESQEELDAKTDGLTGRQLHYTVTWTGM